MKVSLFLSVLTIFVSAAAFAETCPNNGFRVRAGDSIVCSGHYDQELFDERLASIEKLSLTASSNAPHWKREPTQAEAISQFANFLMIQSFPLKDDSMTFTEIRQTGVKLLEQLRDHKQTTLETKNSISKYLQDQRILRMVGKDVCSRYWDTSGWHTRCDSDAKSVQIMNITE